MRSTSSPVRRVTGRAYTREGTANSWPRKRASTCSSRSWSFSPTQTQPSPNRTAKARAILPFDLRSVRRGLGSGPNTDQKIGNRSLRHPRAAGILGRREGTMADKKDKSDGKIWRARFEGGTDPRMERFSASVDVDGALFREDVRGSIAHARMLARQGILTAPEAEQLAKALEQVGDEIASGALALDPALEDVHANVE